MDVWKLRFGIVLLVSSVAVYSTFAGRISDKIREKRSYEYQCEEKVLQKSPTCEMITCPDGIHGAPQYVYKPCRKIPDVCPKKITNESAACCPDKCVCNVGEIDYGAGKKFTFAKDGKQWECTCVQGEVQECEPIYLIIPPKEPPRPPPVFPPPGGFPPEREEE